MGMWEDEYGEKKKVRVKRFGYTEEYYMSNKEEIDQAILAGEQPSQISWPMVVLIVCCLGIFYCMWALNKTPENDIFKEAVVREKDKPSWITHYTDEQIQKVREAVYEKAAQQKNTSSLKNRVERLEKKVKQLEEKREKGKLEAFGIKEGVSFKTTEKGWEDKPTYTTMEHIWMDKNGVYRFKGNVIWVEKDGIEIRNDESLVPFSDLASHIYTILPLPHNLQSLEKSFIKARVNSGVWEDHSK